MSIIIRAFGEALTQFFIIGSLIFLFERIDLFLVTTSSWNPIILWGISEAGIVFVLTILSSLILTNVIFAFVKLNWWVRGLLESLFFILSYFIFNMIFGFIVDFEYSNIFILILILFTSVITTNLIFNKLIPNQ